MNLYILVEGETETIVYPKWISILLPFMVQVTNFDEIINDCFYLFNSGGYPSILDDIVTAVDDINQVKAYDYLVICLDSDDLSSQEKYDEVMDYIHSASLVCSAEIVVIIQTACMETWFLGNRRICSKSPQGTEFRRYRDFYDVFENDPEAMLKIDDFEGTKAEFHYTYLKKMLEERRTFYRKTRPNVVCEDYYLKEVTIQHS